MIKLVPLFGVALWFAASTIPGIAPGKERPYKETFDVDRKDLTTTGRSAYFILEPGYRLHLVGTENGKKVDLTITVLDDTETVAGVETRVVEERETADGSLVEVSRNLFAISRVTRDVYYFGEHVDRYREGKVVSHKGAWLAGEGENRFGLVMPGTPEVGVRYYQEIAPKTAMDRAEITSLTDSLTTPAGLFQRVLKTEETTPLEPGEKEYKRYAPGVGLIQDGDLELDSYGMKE